MTGTHNPLEDMDTHERGAFDELIRPDDSYTKDGTYWADLPLGQKIKFVGSYDAAETRRELASIWEMIKVDPLSPFSYYFRNMVLPGAGLGLEGYVLFSIGNIKPLFENTFPECWDTATTCNQQWLNAVEYLEIIGIIVGQILVGIIGDWYVSNRGQREKQKRLTRIQVGTSVGFDSGCLYHVSRTDHAYGCVGHNHEWLGDLLCLVVVLLQYWSW
jgi:hypothetical protein